jgi:hypothetical protein
LDSKVANELADNLSIHCTEAPSFNLLELGIFEGALKAQLAVLRTVVRNLRRLDRDTFMYFLLQYFHQAQYENFLKIAVRRERDFDEPFRQLHLSEAAHKAHSTQASLYFRDYYFDYDGNSKDYPYLTVHPYYFPSGNLYSVYPDPMVARDHCLMIEDGKEEKIQICLQKMRDLDRPRFLLDLLSFAHWLSLGDEPLRKSIRSWFMKAGILESWELYAVEKDMYAHRVREWSLLMFSSFAEEEHLPYFCLPYVWRECGVTEEREIDLVRLVLDRTRTRFQLPKLQ